jgi:glyoxylate utilization-related uncharacterized protein
MAEGKPTGKFIHRDQAKIVKRGGNEIATLLSAAESAGRFAVREIVAEPGATPLGPLSAADNRYLFVVAGEWEIAIGPERRVAAEGVAAFVPAGRDCTARVTGKARGKLLEIAAPVSRNA